MLFLQLWLCRGHDPTVGAIGLTLGGGHGALARMYGLAADNVVSFTIVAVTGEVSIEWRSHRGVAF